ncbi:MAG: hypothetical protein H7Z43_13820, partial [Clostridia bacterium]|nr:hypothetical protein [Deltaproteobacteria bacterium]
YTYRQTEGVPNFTIASPNGIKAKVVLDGTTSIARRLGDIGIRATFRDGSAEATVKLLDWPTGRSDLHLALDARVDKALVTLGSQKARISANAKVEMDIRSNGGNTPPVIRGVLDVDTMPGDSDVSGKDATAIELLPNNVAGFGPGGFGGVRASVNTPFNKGNKGRIKFTVPFTVDEKGVRSENRQLKYVKVEGTGLRLQTSFVTKDVASGAVELAPRAEPGALSAAEKRHKKRIATINDTIPALQPLAAVPTTTAVDLRGNDAPLLLGRKLKDIDLTLTTRVSEDYNFRVYQGDFGARVDLAVRASTQIRLIIESTNGAVSIQDDRLQDGSLNRTGKQPSGMTFDPPVELRTPLGTVQLKAVNIVPVPGSHGTIRFEPVLGNNLEAQIMRALAIDTAITDEIGKQMLRALTGSPEAPENTAQLAQMIATTTNLQIGAAASLGSANGAMAKRLDFVPAGYRPFALAALSNMRFSARGSLREDAVVGLGDDGQLTVKKGNTLTVSNARGGLSVWGDVSFGPTRVKNGPAQLSFKEASARLAFSNLDGKTTLALTGMNAKALDVRAQFPRGLVAVSNASLKQGDLSIAWTGAKVAYSGNLDGLSAETLELKQANGSYVRVSASQGSRARVARLSFSPTGSVSFQRLSGVFTANGIVDPKSRFYIERADITGGSVNLNPKGGLITSPLSLRNVIMKATNVEVPPGQTTPRAIVASIRGLDVRASEATFTVADGGYALTTPKGKPGRIGMSIESVGFRLPSPQATVYVSRASASGLLRSLRLSPRNQQQTLTMSDLYITGDARGSIVAGPPDSPASKL